MKKNILVFVFLTSYMLTAQNYQTIEEISANSCNCISEIEPFIEAAEKNEEIKSCITSAIIHDQMKNSFLNQLENLMEEAKSKEKDSINITIDSEKNYREIEQYLLRNCEVLQMLISSDDTTREKSISYKEEAIALYKEGNEYFSKGDYESAIKAYEKSVAEDENFAFAWDNMAICYRRLGQYETAIKYYNISLQIDPEGRVPLINKAVAYELLEDYQSAIRGFKLVKEVYPKDPEGYYGLGRMYFMTENYSEALENIFKAYYIYVDLESPYIHDAENVIINIYDEMKALGKLEEFQKLAKEYNINIED